MIEKMIFNMLAIVLFIVIFFIMARRNDTNYVAILILEAIGIGVNFVELNFQEFGGIAVKIIEYLLAIVIPIAVLIAEKKDFKYSELFSIVKAKFYILTGKNELARKALIDLVSKYPNSYMGRKALAKIYEEQKDYENAVIEYYRAADIKKEDFNSHYKVAELFIKVKKYNEAENALNGLLKEKPDFYDASNLLGDLLYEQKRFKEAIGVYMEALRYYPDDYYLYYSLGMIYVGLNDFQNANMCYSKAAELNSRLYNAYYTLGQLSMIANDLDEAERYFTESLYEETEPDSYYELARIYMLKGDKEKAITFVQKTIELNIKFLDIAKKEPLFIPIKQYLVEPEIKKEPEEILTEKEIEIKKKLINMAGIVEKIGFKQREEKRENDLLKEKNDKIKYKE